MRIVTTSVRFNVEAESPTEIIPQIKEDYPAFRFVSLERDNFNERRWDVRLEKDGGL